jgi:predicted transcriptional regulator
VSLHADLTSVLSTLDQVMERIEEAAGAVDGQQREDLLVDLHEVERHLRSASRRLNRTLAGLPEHNGS